ncbi:MAG: hypothetical protein ABJC62_13135 [Frankiaceae bacterium]
MARWEKVDVDSIKDMDPDVRAEVKSRIAELRTEGAINVKLIRDMMTAIRVNDAEVQTYAASLGQRVAAVMRNAGRLKLLQDGALVRKRAAHIKKVIWNK